MSVGMRIDWPRTVEARDRQHVSEGEMKRAFMHPDGLVVKQWRMFTQRRCIAYGMSTGTRRMRGKR